MPHTSKKIIFHLVSIDKLSRKRNVFALMMNQWYLTNVPRFSHLRQPNLSDARKTLVFILFWFIEIWSNVLDWRISGGNLSEMWPRHGQWLIRDNVPPCQWFFNYMNKIFVFLISKSSTSLNNRVHTQWERSSKLPKVNRVI